MTYERFHNLPAYTFGIFKDGKVTNKGGLPLWCRHGDQLTPPAIGTEINVVMNRIGRATVFGYFTEGGYLGLLVRIHDAPEWHRKQNKGDTTGHIFGPEFELVED